MMLAASKGGWDGVFEKDLTMYCGIGIDHDERNDSLTRSKGGLFVWSDGTMAKLEELKVNGTLQFNQLKLVCVSLNLMYSLMMANADII